MPSVTSHKSPPSPSNISGSHLSALLSLSLFFAFSIPGVWLTQFLSRSTSLELVIRAAHSPGLAFVFSAKYSLREGSGERAVDKTGLFV